MPYERALKEMGEHVWADRKMLWTEEALQRDPLFVEHREAFAELERIAQSPELRGHKQWRPYCAAFKPIIILRAMSEARKGDYVLWTDSSKYAGGAGLAVAADQLREGLRQLDERAPAQSLTALVHCGIDCTQPALRYEPQSRLISARTANGYEHLVPRAALFARAGLLTTHLIWKVSEGARQLALEWLQMALDQRQAFCASHTQDQAAMTVLAANRSLQLADMCPFMRPPWLKNKCHDTQKLLGAAIGALARGEFVMRPL